MSLTYIGYSKAIISASGSYVIDRDITCTHPNDSAIYINPGVHHVKLDIRSRIECAAGPANLSNGIEANGSAAVQIMGQGGLIRGFRFGVRMSNCNLARVRQLFIQDGTFRGIVLDGEASIVEDCDVRNIGGSTHAGSLRSCGIEISGGRPKILRNSVENVFAAVEEALGVSVTDRGMGGLVAFNALRNAAPAAPLANGYAGSYGVWIGGASEVAATHNLLEGWAVGIAYSSPPSGMVDENAYRNCTVKLLDTGGDVAIGASDLID